MLPSKTRSSLSETSNNKPVPATTKAGRVGRSGPTKPDSGTPPPLPRPRSSPRPAESKPAVERRAPKPNSATSDKQSRAPKGSELQVQEDLKKAKEQLACAEQEKARVVKELKDAERLADEANERLKEALAAQKRAEESSEIEKLRADELGRARLESSKKQEEWEKELDSIKKEHSLEVEALLAKARELEKVRDELEVTTKAKISALSQAEEATRAAKANAQKVELLYGEISHLKTLLDAKLDSSNGDTAEMIKKLDAEIDSLRYELEKAKQTEEKVVIMESLVERLSAEADNAKSAELNSLKLADEWKKKAELLEIRLTEAKQSEKSPFEMLTSVKKQLEECSALLQDTELEISALRQKIELLEDRLEEANEAEKSSSESQVALEKQLEEVNASLQDAESEAAVLRGKLESLEIEVADVKKAEWHSAKLADDLQKKAESLEAQLAEANQFTDSSSDSLASVTKQLEDSNSSLQDVLSENAALRVKIESLEVELARCKQDIKDSERHLDAARQEAIEMGRAAEGLKSEIRTLEQALSTEKGAAADADSFLEERNKLLEELEVARQEEVKARKAMEDLASALHEMSAETRETQERFFAKRVEHEEAHAQIEQLRSALRNTEENYEIMLDEARYEIVCLKKAIQKLETEAKESQDHNLGVVEEAKGKTLRLLNRENEVSSIGQENAELQIQEANELSALVAEAITKESGELSNSEKEYDLLPSSKEIPMESVNGSKEEKPKLREVLKLKEENGNGHHYLGEEEPVEVVVKMLKDYEANENDKDLSSEMENEGEAIDDDLEELKMGSGSFDNTNGLPSDTTEDAQVSPTKQQQQQQQQKKKKHLFIFGNLLKKKSPNK